MPLPRVFIDGEAGTTGLGIYQRLSTRSDLEIVRIAPELRKEASERQRLIASADVAILCLPDDAAREAVGWAASTGVRILDASTAHRVAAQWTYGLPELGPDQRQKIRAARHVANPGCYPTGVIALLRPLIAGGLLSASKPITIHAVSGYSGGGRKLIERFEQSRAPHFGAYGLSLTHKHVPEMKVYTGLESAPLFCPSVGNFYAGMLVFVPVPRPEPTTSAAEVQRALAEYYQGEPFVAVKPLNDMSALDAGYLDPEALNGTNRIELFVYANEASAQMLLAARLDNLGKGASGAAVQNLNLMLGIEETRGLL